ncbi:MXAN_6640 family putative metalloprotease [Rhodohalobacter sp.]|uniref:MXAN_6640 family putative metalloprotease n=1 Tax=Rhodohalobacter sp. TaxID=1974210 RepID=UPI00356A865C
MRYSKYLILLFLLVGLTVVSVDSLAQTVQHPVFRELDEALNRGEISRETALIEKLRFTYRPGELHQHLHEKKEHSTIKCTVPLHAEFLHLKDQLTANTVAEIEPYFERPETSHLQEYISDSGNFILYYETDGQNAVPAESTIEPGVPDYIYLAAEAADSSYRYEVQELGFVDFLRNEPYEIFFEDIIFYGTTTSSGSSSFITINNNFENFPENAHPDGNAIGALYATIAHEIKHAIQYATNGWDGSAGSFDWIEMDATLMEEIVYPDVDDYYNYILDDFDSDEPNSLSIFGAPGSATPGAYWHVTWMLYFTEQYGMEFWVDVWQQFIEERTKPFFDAVESSLAERNRQLNREHLNNMLWHLASGPIYSLYDFGFEDRENYPNPNISNSIGMAPGDTRGFSLRGKAAHFMSASPSNVALGQPQFTIESDVSGVGLGVIGYFRDGSADVQLALQPDSEIQSLQTIWKWEDLIDISIAVVNTNRSAVANYDLNITSALPETDRIAQNYPNPFNPTTKIEYAITETQDVKIEVFDTIGKKVATLVDSQMPAGFYSVDFDGNGLASGVYIYRIVTDNTVSSNKMVLIK